MNRPAHPVRLDRGKIHWEEPMERKGSQNQLHVWVECECGTRRLVHPGDMKRRNRLFSGICLKCHRREHYSNLNNLRGPQSSRYKGPKRIDRSGYVQVALYPGDEFYDSMGTNGRHGYCRYVLEHRLVMARFLRRPLHSWEHVHHKDHDKANNRIENLEIVDGKTHAAITALESENIRLANEILRLRTLLDEQHLRP